MQVKERTSNYNNYALGSHVMQYGDTNITDEKLYLYHGFDPATVNLPPNNGMLEAKIEVVNQRDAEILFMWQMVYSLQLSFNIRKLCSNDSVLRYINSSIIFSVSEIRRSNRKEERHSREDFGDGET